MTSDGAASTVTGAPLPRRPLGRSKVAVTELSFGGAAIGGLYTEVSEALSLRALDIPAALWDSLATADEGGCP